MVTRLSRPFDDDFRRLVVPRVVRAIQIEAALAGLGWQSFDQAVGGTMAYACAYGAGYLSAGELDGLYDWVIDQVAELVDRELPP